MITPALFKTRFVEFDCINSPKIQMFIDDSTLILNEAYWGVKYDLGLYYLTAHLLTLSEKSSAGNAGGLGQVASRSVDGASISYNNAPLNNQSDAFYAATVYGQRYLALRKNLGIPAYVI